MIYDHENKTPFRSKIRPNPPPLEPHLWEAMETYIKERGLDFRLARSNQWYPTFDPVDKVGRIVIPCANSEGVSYWQARVIEPYCNLCKDSPPVDKCGVKRYTSPMASREDSIVVCWPVSKPYGSPIGVVVEGPFDSLGACECGAVGIGIMGNSPPSKVMLKVAYLLRGLSVVVVPDADAPQFGAMVVACLASQGVRVRMLNPVKKDLAAMPLEERCALLS